MLQLHNKMVLWRENIKIYLTSLEHYFFNLICQKNFWKFATTYAVYLLNRIPSLALNNKTPFEMLHGKLLDLTSLKVFV